MAFVPEGMYIPQVHLDAAVVVTQAYAQAAEGTRCSSAVINVFILVGFPSAGF